MGSELELDVNPKMEVLIDAPGPSTNTEPAGLHMPIAYEAKAMQCASNREDSVFDTEASMGVGQKGELNDEHIEVDIVNEGVNIGNTMQIKEPVAAQDSTEYSSSFSGTLSCTENDAALIDGEVQSQYFDGSMPEYCIPGFYGGFMTRKKRLTDHWSRFIRPLRWRCKWLELQINELQSRALEYDNELAKYEEAKQHLYQNVTSEDYNARSLAFSGQLPRMDVMKRRKRKRVEETVDVASYMSNHNLFSYYHKKITSDRSLIKDVNANQDGNGIHSLGIDDPLLRNGDTSMEQILAKIVMVQSQVHHLKTRIEKVIRENPGKFSSVNRLSLVVPGTAENVFDEEPVSPAVNGQISSVKSLYAASQLVSEDDDADLLLPDQAVSDHGDIAALPDVVESTKQIEDGVLINNQAAEEELLRFKKVGDEQDKKPERQSERQSERQLERQKKAASPGAVPEADLPMATPSPLEASNVKSRPTLKTYISKRKRRRRGAAILRKTKRMPG